MIYSEFLRLKYNYKIKSGIAFLILYALITSFLLVRAIPGQIAVYDSVGLVYEIKDFLFLWFGYHRFISIPSFRVLFFATRLFPFIFLPLLLSWFGTDTFTADHVHHCVPLLYLRSSGKKYFAGKLAAVFAASFLTVLFFLFLQLNLAVIGCLFLKGKGIRIPDFNRTDILIIAVSCIKIPLYYASIAAASYGITLFIHAPSAPYMLPVIITVGSSVLFAEATNNVPMDLAFYDSGLMTPHMEIYWFSVLLFLLMAAILTWVKICMIKDLLEDS